MSCFSFFPPAEPEVKKRGTFIPEKALNAAIINACNTFTDHSKKLIIDTFKVCFLWVASIMIGLDSIALNKIH